VFGVNPRSRTRGVAAVALILGVVAVVVGFGPRAASADPTPQTRLAFVRGDGSGPISLLDPSGAAKDVGPSGSAPSWAPDGRRLAFAGAHGGGSDIFVVNDDGSGLSDFSGGAAVDSSPAWSPDAARIAFVRQRTDGSVAVVVMDTSGSRIARSSVSVGPPDRLSWSPDGTRIVYGAQGHLFVLTLGGGTQALTSGPQSDGEPAWSPDGSTIAFVSSRDGGGRHVYAVGATGGSATRLTAGPGTDSWPTWSPDGKRIAYGASQGGAATIFTMSADGSGVGALARGSQPTWGRLPDARPPATSASSGARSGGGGSGAGRRDGARPIPIRSGPARLVAAAGGATVSASDAFPDPGDPETLKGSGFAPNSTLQVTFQTAQPAPPALTPVPIQTDGSGSFQADVTAPLGAPAGKMTIVVSGPLAGGGNGQATTQVEVQDVSCDDFEDQEGAQAVLDANPADPNHLDPNHTGRACAGLPPRSSLAASGGTGGPGGAGGAGAKGANPALKAAGGGAAGAAAGGKGGAGGAGQAGGAGMPNTGAPADSETSVALVLLGVGFGLETAAFPRRLRTRVRGTVDVCRAAVGHGGRRQESTSVALVRWAPPPARALDAADIPLATATNPILGSWAFPASAVTTGRELLLRPVLCAACWWGGHGVDACRHVGAGTTRPMTVGVARAAPG